MPLAGRLDGSLSKSPGHRVTTANFVGFHLGEAGFGGLLESIKGKAKLIGPVVQHFRYRPRAGLCTNVTADVSAKLERDPQRGDVITLSRQTGGGRGGEISATSAPRRGIVPGTRVLTAAPLSPLQTAAFVTHNEAASSTQLCALGPHGRVAEKHVNSPERVRVLAAVYQWAPEQVVIGRGHTRQSLSAFVAELKSNDISSQSELTGNPGTGRAEAACGSPRPPGNHRSRANTPSATYCFNLFQTTSLTQVCDLVCAGLFPRHCATGTEVTRPGPRHPESRVYEDGYRGNTSYGRHQDRVGTAPFPCRAAVMERPRGTPAYDGTRSAGRRRPRRGAPPTAAGVMDGDNVLPEHSPTRVTAYHTAGYSSQLTDAMAEELKKTSDVVSHLLHHSPHGTPQALPCISARSVPGLLIAQLLALISQIYREEPPGEMKYDFAVNTSTTSDSSS
ncbi:hypothetical protein Bbelb_439500 [Branchiostoma belcheri]|nr:hypothetical protein Bbelb_439500 [Branchiostoma belcheri]